MLVALAFLASVLALYPAVFEQIRPRPRSERSLRLLKR